MPLLRTALTAAAAALVLAAPAEAAAQTYRVSICGAKVSGDGFKLAGGDGANHDLSFNGVECFKQRNEVKRSVWQKLKDATTNPLVHRWQCESSTVAEHGSEPRRYEGLKARAAADGWQAFEEPLPHFEVEIQEGRVKPFIQILGHSKARTIITDDDLFGVAKIERQRLTDDGVPVFETGDVCREAEMRYFKAPDTVGKKNTHVTGQGLIVTGGLRYKIEKVEAETEVETTTSSAPAAVTGAPTGK